MKAEAPLIIRTVTWRDSFRKVHQPPIGWLGELITCVCGHGIGRHSGRACEGDIRGGCNCRFSPDSVLEQATFAERERSEPDYASPR